MMVERAVERRHGAIEILFIAVEDNAVEATTFAASLRILTASLRILTSNLSHVYDFMFFRRPPPPCLHPSPPLPVLPLVRLHPSVY